MQRYPEISPFDLVPTKSECNLREDSPKYNCLKIPLWIVQHEHDRENSRGSFQIRNQQSVLNFGLPGRIIQYRSTVDVSSDNSNTRSRHGPVPVQAPPDRSRSPPPPPPLSPAVSPTAGPYLKIGQMENAAQYRKRDEKWSIFHSSRTNGSSSKKKNKKQRRAYSSPVRLSYDIQYFHF